MTREQASKLGTLSHNTTFSPRDAREYGLTLSVAWLLRRGYIARTERGRYALTRDGWLAVRVALEIEAAS